MSDSLVPNMMGQASLVPCNITIVRKFILAIPADVGGPQHPPICDTISTGYNFLPLVSRVLE